MSQAGRIEDGRTGLPVDPGDLRTFGERVSGPLDNPHRAERMGEAGADPVRELFPGAQHFGHYVDSLERVLAFE
jgi:hypothetical protein